MKKELFFEKEGNGIPIVMLHGNPGTSKDFDRIKKYINLEKYSLYALDRVGHGKSSALLGEDPIKVYKEFLNKHCSDGFFLLTFSMGAYYGLKIATEMSDKIKGIFLISPYILTLSDDKVSSIPKIVSTPILGNILKLLLPTLAQKSIKNHILDFTHPIKPDEEWMNSLMDEYLKVDSLLATLSDKNYMIENPLDFESLKKLNCKFYSINGRLDKKNMGHLNKLKVFIPQIEVDIEENSGHAMIFTKSDIIGEKIEKFLK